MKLFEMYGDDDDDRRSGLSKADRWLSKYTRESFDKWPTANIIKTLLNDYPFDGGVLYRGLNFNDAEQWEKFKEETHDLTKLDTGSISSWSTDRGTTESFALTRPTYFLNHELMQAESQKNKNRDYMIGHVGVIIKTRVAKGVGIDVNKSNHGKESEVILPPGVYNIEVDTKHIPFVKSINSENVKKEFMSIDSIDDHKISGKKFAHIMFHYKEFDKEMQDHLFKLILEPFKELKLIVEVSDQFNFSGDWRKGKLAKVPQIEIHWNIPGEFFVFYDLLTPTDKSKVDKIVQAALKQIDKKYSDLMKKHKITPQDEFQVRVAPSVVAAVKLERYKSDFMAKTNRMLGQRYHHLNSYDAVKSINKIDDPKKKQEAIQKMAKDIERLLNQFN